MADPDIGLLNSIHADGSRKAIHPADVKGRFISARRWVFLLLIAVYVLLPTLKMNGHPLVHLNIGDRKFYLFGNTFNAQDFWMVLFLVTGLGFTLLFLTSWLGRVWCGWACPQTVFLEGVFRRIERFIEGPREARIRRSQGPWSVDRLIRAALRHGAYLLVSALLAHVFLSLFVSAEGLFSMIQDGPKGHFEPFAWAAGSTALLYVNFAWFREQLCVVICPYGRLQSVLLDKDSLVIGYDIKRGDPRGKLKPKETFEGRGDCIECKRCIAVCPTGIDIRNGVQLECVACAQCIDACDEIMDKVGRPRGLIRYDSMNGLEGKPRRVLRPRLFVYGALVGVAISAVVLSLWGRTPFEANVLRMPGPPYILDGEFVRNQFEIHLVNKRPENARFRIQAVNAPPDMRVIVPIERHELPSLGSVRAPVMLSQDKKLPARTLTLDVTDEGSGEKRTVELKFIAPPR